MTNNTIPPSITTNCTTDKTEGHDGEIDAGFGEYPEQPLDRTPCSDYSPYEQPQTPEEAAAEEEALMFAAMGAQMEPPHVLEMINPRHNENALFTAEMVSNPPAGAAPLVCGFTGDPNSKADPRWWPNDARPGKESTVFRRDDRNAYIVVSSFYQGECTNKKTGKKFMAYARRKSTFAALHFIMLDDLGTGPGAKLSMDKLALEPTALIETSPDNYQAMLKLAEPLTDRVQAEKLIQALIYQGLLSKGDPGMAGVTRYCRLPVGINGKPKYKKHSMDPPFQVHMVEYDINRQYTVDEIVEAFGLDLSKVSGGESRRDVHASIRKKAGITAEQIDIQDDPLYSALLEADVFGKSPVIQDKGDGDIWIDMECPWVENHTDRADTGSAYRIGGAFKCHHSCEGGIREALIKLGRDDLLPVLDQMQADKMRSDNLATIEALMSVNPFPTTEHNQRIEL